MNSRQLHNGWQFRLATPGVGYWRPNEPANPWRPAQVPGHIHDDLVRNGMLGDPFVLEQEAGAQWASHEDWVYGIDFRWTPDPRHPVRKLVFEGLDTVCEVRLNGVRIAEHDNMFLPLEADVSDQLAEGENRLEVTFRSPVRVGMERRKAYFDSNGIDHGTSWFDERAFLRKAQYMSGWDWGPRLVSCGIWRPVRLDEYAARIRSFTVFQERLEDGRFRVWSETDIDGSDRLATTFDGREFEGDFDLTVEEPRLWWPNGEGEPFLYQASARLSTGQQIEKKVGLRTVRLIQEENDLGESFEFEVNGRRIYARGANWIPNDSFPSRVSEDDYRAQIQTCAQLNMNMLRVWGGGLYELEAFYDACDEFGILVWQDFPYGCSYYPDGPEEQQAAAAEAEFHVRRLRDRACLAIWCGNNENDVMWSGKWGGLEKSPPRYCGDVLYGQVLADVCARLDPGRAYIRSSPIGRQEGAKSWGDSHYWDVWHGRGDWKYYADSLTRFSSEFGFASGCGAAAWRLSKIEPANYSPHDLPVVWHDKTNKPHEVFVGMVELHYPPSATLEDWNYFSQLNQRDALRFGIEHYRTNAYCRGVLIWQFNDCWPVQSWAVQDYARELKIAGFEMARLCDPVLLSIRVGETSVEVWAANDGPELFDGPITFQVIHVDGSVQKSAEVRRTLAPGERAMVLEESLRGLDSGTTVFRASVEDRAELETWRTLGEPKDMSWPAPKFALEGEWLSVMGLAYDLTIENKTDPNRSLFANPPFKGQQAKCLANTRVRLCLDDPKGTIRLRCMAGIVEL